MVTKIGVLVPADYDRTGQPVVTASDGDTTFVVSIPTDAVGALIETSSDDVGLVTWWRADSVLEALTWVDDEIGSDFASEIAGEIVSHGETVTS